MALGIALDYVVPGIKDVFNAVSIVTVFCSSRLACCLKQRF